MYALIFDMTRKDLFRFFFVPKCPSCLALLKRDEWVLCSECKANYENEKERRCSRCNERLCECSCSIPHLDTHKVRSLHKITRYNPHADNVASPYLIYSLKREHRRDVIDFMADELCATLSAEYADVSSYLITNVPRRYSALMEHGYDHAAKLAKAISKRLGCEYKALLKSKARRAQKSLSPEERQQNASFTLSSNESLKGRVVLLVDDIVTSGASMGKCADTLRALHPKRMIGVCFSIAYRDPYTPHISSNEWTSW